MNAAAWALVGAVVGMVGTALIYRVEVERLRMKARFWRGVYREVLPREHRAALMVSGDVAVELLMQRANDRAGVKL